MGIKLFFTIHLICALVFFGCRKQNTISVGVSNVGKTTVDSVVIAYTGDSILVGTIPAKTSVSRSIIPHGDSHIELTFTDPAHGRKRLIVGTYFQRGDSGSIFVSFTADSIVSVLDSIQSPHY